MKNDSKEPYSVWLDEKRQELPSEDFADRVMTTITPLPQALSRSRFERVALFARVAILILAAVAGFSRYGLLIYFVLFGNN